MKDVLDLNNIASLTLLLFITYNRHFRSIFFHAWLTNDKLDYYTVYKLKKNPSSNKILCFIWYQKPGLNPEGAGKQHPKFVNGAMNVIDDLQKHMQLVGFVVRGESPGCRLISTVSMFECLRNLLPHHSQGAVRKMEPKYPEGGHCRSVLRPRGVFNVPLYFK